MHVNTLVFKRIVLWVFLGFSSSLWSYPLGNKDLSYRIELAKQALEHGDLSRVDSLVQPVTVEQVLALDGEMLCLGLKMLGISAYYQEDYILSNVYYSLLLRHPNCKGNDTLKASILNNRGINYEILGSLDSALINYKRSLSFDQKVGDTCGVMMSGINLGILAGKLGRFKEAESYLRHPLSHFQLKGRSRFIALASLNMGLVKLWQKNYDSAIVYLERSRVLSLSISDSLGAFKAETNLIRAFLNAGMYDTAIYLLNNEDIYFDRGLNWRPVLTRHLLRVELLLRKEQNKEARAIMEKRILPHVEKMKLIGLYEQLLLLRIQLSGAEGRVARMQFWSNKLAEYTNLLRQTRRNNLWQELELEAELLQDSEETFEAKSLLPKKKGHFSIAIILALVMVLLIKFRFQVLRLIDKKPKTEDDAVGVRTGVGEEARMAQEHTDLFRRLESYLTEEERFRDPDCNMTSIAKGLGTNKSYLSKAVNQGSGTNFRGYLNKLRVESAKRELNQNNNSKSISQIAYDVGYKSASVFSRVFKEYTGCLPKDWGN